MEQEMRPSAGSIESMLERIDEQRAAIDDMRRQISVLRGALLAITEWKPPYPRFSSQFGSNGERDHFRSVARRALDDE